MNRTLVSVETSGFFTERLARAAKEAGDTPLHATAANPPAGIDSIQVDVRLGEPHEIAERFRAAAKQPIAAVFTTQELLVGRVAAVADVLGVATIPAEAVSRARDKAAMKQAWSAAGVRTPKGVHHRSRSELDLTKLRYPLIVKPTHGFASCGVRRVNTEDELFTQLRKIGLLNATTIGRGAGTTTGFLIEECLDGDEYSVDTVWFDGEPVGDLMLSHVHLGGATGPYYPDRLYVLDRRMDPALRERVVELTHDAVRALGISRGPTHTEVRFHGDTPYVLETAVRPGAGGMFYEMLRLAHGPDLFGAMYASLIGGEHRVEPAAWSALDADYYWYNMPYSGDGIVSDIVGLDEVRAMTDVLLCVAFKGKGDHLSPDGDLNSDYFCNILARHPEASNRASIDAALRLYDDTVRVVY